MADGGQRAARSDPGSEQSTGIPEELLAEFEERLLPYAGRLVPARFERMARTLRESLAPEGMIQRHRDALKIRTTGLEPGPDGMAWYGGVILARRTRSRRGRWSGRSPWT